MAKSQVYPQKKIGIRDLGKTVWDLSSFKPSTYDTIRMKRTKKTRFGRRFPEANVAMVYTPVNMEYLVIDSGCVYLSGLINDFMEKKLPVLLRFRDKLLYKNPHLKIDEQYSDTSETYFVSPYYHHPGTDSIRADIRYIRTGRVDASGELITPVGKYQVEREVIFVEKRVRGFKYSVFGWTPATEYSLNRHFTFYRWYTKENKLPIAEAYLNDEDLIEYVRYQYDSPLRLTFTGEHVNCKGGSNGAVDLSVTGGIPDYSYKWTNGETNQDLKNVKAGTYRVVVTDNRGRTISSYYTVTEPLVALEAKLDVKHISCRGKKDGRVKLDIIGGKEPYDFAWSNDSVNEILSNLPPGKIHLRVIDAGGCVIRDSIEITQPDDKIAINFEKKHISCFKGNNGAVEVLTRGGTAPYHFLWTDGDTSRIKTGMIAGEHSITAYDKNNCSVVKTVSLGEPKSPIKISSKIKPVSCYAGSDGTIELDVSGGKPPYQYLWSDSSTIKSIRGYPSGQYDVTVVDRNDCKLKESFSISQPGSAVKITSIKKDINCFGDNSGEISLTISGGNPTYSYFWSNGATKPNIKKLTKGVYTVKIMDEKQCNAYDTIEILSPKSALFADFEKFDVKCHKGNDGEIKLTITGGTPDYSYLWSNKSTQMNLSGLKSGKYSVVITDRNLCSLKKEFEITEPDKHLNVTVEKINVNCYGEKSGSIYITVKGGKPGYDFEWSTGSDAPNIIGIGEGKYTVTISDQLLCRKTEIILLAAPKKLTVEPEINHPNKEKENGSIKIVVMGGTEPYSILWDEGQMTNVIKNLRPGIHEVQITDSKDCILNERFELKEK